MQKNLIFISGGTIKKGVYNAKMMIQVSMSGCIPLTVAAQPGITNRSLVLHLSANRLWTGSRYWITRSNAFKNSMP